MVGKAGISTARSVVDNVWSAAGRPARRLGRNGQLRITFHQVVPPSGMEQEIEATLEGIDITKSQNVKLDSEGGAQVARGVRGCDDLHWPE